MASEGRICVTGAAGYIGSHVVKQLLESGYEVRATVRDSQNPARVSHLLNLGEAAPGKLEIVSADLLEEGAFDEPVADCDAVCHVASAVRLHAKQPQHDIVDVAVKGTRNVLSSVARSPSVKRVVLTSSVAAVIDYQKPEEHVYTEEDWAEDANVDTNPYGLSKTLAEQNAWAFQQSVEQGAQFDMVALNPAVVFGPTLAKVHLRTSPGLLWSILSGKVWGCPRLHFNVVDVRDVAQAHVKAIETPDAAGRFILSHRGMWWQEIAQFLHEQFPSFPIKTRALPDLLLYAAALFDRRVSVSYLRRNLGRRLSFDTGRSLSELGVRYRDPLETLYDTCRSLIEQGWVHAPA